LTLEQLRPAGEKPLTINLDIQPQQLCLLFLLLTHLNRFELNCSSSAEALAVRKQNRTGGMKQGCDLMEYSYDRKLLFKSITG
jgi:hypothetical protein